MALSTVEDVVVAANLYMAYDLLKKQRKAVSETSTSATGTARYCLFFNTDRGADLAIAVAEVAVSDLA